MVECPECGSEDIEVRTETPFPADHTVTYQHCNGCGGEWT